MTAVVDQITATGLETATLPEILAALISDFQTIYGAGINVDQNSPNGQELNIYAQGGVDNRELATDVYNSFNPDRAVGSVLDERCAINNIIRKAGTFTIQPVDVTVSTTVILQGLDGNFNNVNATGYTVQDDAGNQFILVDTTTLTVGTTTLNFRAAVLGAVETTTNTINNPVTIVNGVTSVNNSSVALSVGQNEETDAQLRIRRQQSVALASYGYLNGLLATVLALDGVNQAALFENVSNTTDANGIPAHGIWLIVEGGANSDIANAIYNKKSYGANMRGAVDVPITTASGEIFHALFDRPISTPLFIKFNIQPTTAITFDEVNIPLYMQNNFSFQIDQAADTADITALALAAINATGGGGTPTQLKISLDGSTWVDYLTAPTLQDQFVISASDINITIL